MVSFKRRKHGRTNYSKRLKLLVARKPRVVIRCSNTRTYIQIVDFSPKGDAVLVGCDSGHLDKLGWKYSKANLSASYLTGVLVAKKALEKDIKEGIIDIGLRRVTKANKLFAAIKGMKDAGLGINLDPKMLPDEKRVQGAHIALYAQSLKKEKADRYQSLFSGHLKKQIGPEDITKNFEEVKQKLLGK